eukprot:sb/3473351/
MSLTLDLYRVIGNIWMWLNLVRSDRKKILQFTLLCQLALTDFIYCLIVAPFSGTVGPRFTGPRFTGRIIFPRSRKLTVFDPDIPGTPIYRAKPFPPSIPVNRGPTVLQLLLELIESIKYISKVGFFEVVTPFCRAASYLRVTAPTFSHFSRL